MGGVGGAKTEKVPVKRQQSIANKTEDHRKELKYLFIQETDRNVPAPGQALTINNKELFAGIDATNGIAKQVF